MAMNLTRELVETEVKTVLNRVTGMPFRWSINPYRGCSHACPFCYARRTHWFIEEDGVNQWSSKIFVKVNAPDVLRRELNRPSWKREEVAVGTATDPYQAIESQYRLTRAILEALRDFRTPVGIITRSPLILRDIDLLTAMARLADVRVCISVATTDAGLARQIEPTVASPARRLSAVHALASSGIRAGVLLAPILPGLTDGRESLAGVIRAARDAGAAFVGHGVLHLGEVTKDAFVRFLSQRYPALLPLYRRLYPRRYAPAGYQRRVAQVVAAEKARVRLLESRHLHPPAAARQLGLF